MVIPWFCSSFRLSITLENLREGDKFLVKQEDSYTGVYKKKKKKQDDKRIFEKKLWL